ncbi:hypothetical protein PIB30_003423 [Stylosanthes scabra]|uniref:Uncharacterized protein n=1 Tax=Stylosanthes scabra TaxID=79078 RepID=A0ABU6U247_9FABA|nr:hypothetical protein [Stylosanthes scabra]
MPTSSFSSPNLLSILELSEREPSIFMNCLRKAVSTISSNVAPKYTPYEDVDEPDDASPKDVVSLKAINASAAASNKHFPSPNSSDGMGFGDRGSTIIFNPRVL